MMRVVSYAQNIHDLSHFKAAGLNEVIIGPASLNRYSTLSQNECTALLEAAKGMNFKVVLEWDALFTEKQFNEAIRSFNQIPTDLYDCIRVQDVGVLEYALSHTSKKIQFITENGNHNLIGLQSWTDYIGDRLDRLVLSIELNKDKLKQYCEALKCEVEYLGMGRILLFYSPRNLLSPLVSNSSEITPRLEALGESEESPHKGFPILQNQHGTFMFHIKDLFLLDKWEELKSTGLDIVRVDLRFCDSVELIKEIVQVDINPQITNLIKERYPSEVIRGYYQINKSDVLFKKLKNYRIQRYDRGYIGEVLEISKGEYLAIQIKSEIEVKKDEKLKFITPEGKVYFCKVYELKDSNYQDQQTSAGNQLFLMNYMGGVWPKSQVYLDT